MKFFYYCDRQLFTAIVAAFIHLHKLPKERTPSIDEILMISEYDQLISGDFGVPYFLGEIYNCQIYAINFDSNVSLALQTIKNILSQRGVDFSKWCFCDIFESKDVGNTFIQIGERLSRKLVTRPLGKYLTAIGIQKKYGEIWEMVKKEQERHG